MYAFLGGFHAQKKPFASGAAPRRQTSPQEVNFCFWLSATIFGPWGLVRLL